MVFTLSFDVSSPQGLADLDVFLRSRSYVVGFSASQSDVELFAALGKAPDAAKFPNVARFYGHIGSFSTETRKGFPAAFGGAHATPAAAPAAKKEGKKEAKKEAAAPAPAAAGAGAAAAEEEDDDLFGDDDGEAEKKLAAKAAAAKAAAADKPAAKPKKVVIDKSAVVYEIKPIEAGQDMVDLEAKVRSVEMDGLLWGVEFKVVDVAFGIQKLIVQAIIEDEKVQLQDLEDKLLAFNEVIQSVDLTTMSKVTGN